MLSIQPCSLGGSASLPLLIALLLMNCQMLNVFRADGHFVLVNMVKAGAAGVRGWGGPPLLYLKSSLNGEQTPPTTLSHYTHIHTQHPHQFRATG